MKIANEFIRFCHIIHYLRAQRAILVWWAWPGQKDSVNPLSTHKIKINKQDNNEKILFIVDMSFVFSTFLTWCSDDCAITFTTIVWQKKCFVSNMLILMMIAASNAVDFSANIQIGKTLWGDFMMWSFFGWIFKSFNFMDLCAFNNLWNALISSFASIRC